MNIKRFKISSVIITLLVISACQPPPDKAEPLPAITSTQTTIPTIPMYTATPTAEEVKGVPLLEEDMFTSNRNHFCESESESSGFNLECKQGVLIINQTEGRRKRDLLLMRDAPLKTASPFQLELKTISESADPHALDQNEYGMYFIDNDDRIHALRIQGQYFDFETWQNDEKTEVIDRFNLSYSPILYPPGQPNYFQLTCMDTGCSLFVNEEFTARFPFDGPTRIIGAGIFTASNWDKQFGKVQFEYFQVLTFSRDYPEPPPYQLIDDLRSDHGTFSRAGLSGAFHIFDEEGFHFSPVVPFGYYSVKAGPSLRDVSIRVKIKMAVEPGKSASRFAGLVCRSSVEGMYMAVIRADGTYSIYRESSQRPTALLAQKTSDAILPGQVNNDLRLDCIDNRIDFYINHNLVESLLDERYGLKFGRAGLYTKAGSNPNANAVIYTDFEIEETP